MSENINRKDLNLGKCPTCDEWTHFDLVKKISKSKSIVKCSFCLNKLKQYKNGKVHYEEIKSHDLFG